MRKGLVFLLVLPFLIAGLGCAYTGATDWITELLMWFAVIVLLVGVVVVSILAFRRWVEMAWPASNVANVVQQALDQRRQYEYTGPWVFLSESDYIEWDDLQGNDLDWFALDDEGHVAHFATGGRDAVPRGLLKTEVLRIYEYFRNEAGNVSDSLESQDWMRLAELNSKTEQKRAQYLSSFVRMSRKGMYSYNCPWSRPCRYVRITIPAKPLVVGDVPDDIAAILRKTVIQGIAFAECCVIMHEQLGECVES